MFEKSKTYKYSDIERFVFDNTDDYNLTELGSNLIGENFVVLKHNEKDITVSFILTSVSGIFYYYECVYSDLKK